MKKKNSMLDLKKKIVLIVFVFLLSFAILKGLQDEDITGFVVYKQGPDEARKDLITIEIGKINPKITNPFRITVLNKEQRPITKDYLPGIRCKEIYAVTVEAQGISIPVSEDGTYYANLSVPVDTVPGTYYCTVRLSNTSTNFYLQVI